MCIVKGAGKFFLRCMPNSGGNHAPACDSYEPPPELSGLGQVMGSAIQDDPDAGLTYDKMLIDAMSNGGRRFSKGLRYTLSSKHPLACVVASDTVPSPTAMYVAAPTASEDQGRALDALISESDLPHWLWDVSAGQMPALPGNAAG